MMHMSLYEIREEFRIADQMIEDWAESHDGDITDFPLWDELDKLAGDRDEKALGIAAWIKNLRAEADAIGDEIRSLTSRKRAKENKAERLKSYLQHCIPEGHKCDNSRASISWRKNTAVHIPGELTPEVVQRFFPELVKTKIEFSKKAMAEEIKSGGVPIQIQNENGKIFEISIPDHKNIQIE